MKGTKIKIKCERFMMNMPEKDIEKVENLARQNRVTMSWLYRAVLFALLKEFSSLINLQTDKIQRPVKFDKSFRKITICMYGDKKKWMTLSRIWQVELGPLIRYGLELFFKGELVLDLESIETVKEAQSHNIGKITISKDLHSQQRCVYQFQNEAFLHPQSSFRPKNPGRNLFLMEMGIKNRKL